MAHSQNGWTVRDRDALVWFTAAGASFAAANRDVAVIAEYLIERFNREVEKVHGPVLDDWSYAVRNVRGSSTMISNHSSATAWDLNAVHHPRGVHGTFSSRQVTAIRKIVRDVNRLVGAVVIAWGGDFSTTVDAMHFEMVCGERTAKLAADKMRHATEDDVTPADIAKIIDGVADEVMRRLAQNRVVPNQKVSISDKAADDMTIVGCLSNVELNQDQGNKAMGEQYKALSGKLDQLITAQKNAAKSVTLNQK